MRKSLLLSVFTLALLLWNVNSFAQCTPDPGVTDPEGNGEMVPDTLHAWEETPMNTTLSIICPATADIGGGSIAIHHITIKSITNKPAWMSYACNPGTCIYNAAQLQCALVTGTPPAGSAATVQMEVIVDVYMNLGGVPVLASSDYNGGTLYLYIHPPASVSEYGENGFGLINPRPNPYTDETQIGCYTSGNEKVELQILDLVGNRIWSESMQTQAGENFFSFNGSGLRPGVYFYSVMNSRGDQLTRKLVKSE